MAPLFSTQSEAYVSPFTPLSEWERDIDYDNARSYLKDNTQQGVRLTIKGVDDTVQFEEASFYCKSELHEYFNVERIDRLLKIIYGDEDRPNARTIRNQFLKVFCILLLIGQLDLIRILVYHGRDDETLPVSYTTDAQPDGFDSIGDPIKRQRLRKAFCEESWKFCPHVFLADAHQIGVDARRILPIVHWTQLGEGNSATTWRVNIHPLHHRLEKSTSPNADTYVLKISNRFEQEAIDAYNSETSAFLKLKEPHADIVKYLGSFHQKDASCILLEYADQGNLEQYFRRQHPRKKEDITAFWDHFLRILWGLQRLHNQFGGSHRDLKPQNILLFSNGELSPYRYTFKIADLGFCHYTSAQTSQFQALRSSTAGSRTFGCPESRRTAAFFASAPNAYQRSDVWSIVCILSVACTWVVDGQVGVKEYSDFRRRGRQNSLAEEEVDSFHDDHEVLPQICKWHTDLQTRSMRIDPITEHMWELIRPGFNPVDIRPDAENLRISIHRAFKSQFDRTLTDDYGIGSSHIPSHKPQQLSTDSSKLPVQPTTPVKRSPTLTGSPPTLSPDRMLFGHDERNHNSVFTRGSNNEEHLQPTPAAPSSARRSEDQARTANDAPAPVSSQLPSGECPKHGGKTTESMTVAELIAWADGQLPQLPHSGLLPPLRMRDHVIVVDNSQTMKRYWDEVENLVHGLASLLVTLDDDGLELFWTNFGHQSFRGAQSLVGKVRSLKHVCQSTTDPKNTIVAIHDKHKKKILKGTGTIFRRRHKSGKPLSVYFLTDGEWRRDSNPKPTIEKLLKYLNDHEKDEGMIGIQFIQFGNSQVGSVRLKDLDDFKPNGLDIVDTTRSDGNVWKMLLGGIDPSFDNDDCICGRDE